MTFLYKNNAVSRLKQPVLAGDGTIVVKDSEGGRFPNPTGGDYFLVTLDDRRTGQVEICKCTARAADTLTVTRAQEGTAAQDFAIDAVVANRFTAGTIDAILAGVGYSKVEADAKFVDVAGDTMTGDLLVPVTPGSNPAAASKQYVDNQVATKLADAPSDANTYGRSAGAWVAVLAISAYTDAAVLAKVKAVDGAGSGLDADLLDGFDSTFFLPAGAYTAADVFAKVLANDGAGSTLDADLLDGQHGAYYLNRANHTGSQAWATIAGTPTTIAGYGITDAYTKGQVDAKTWDWSTAITSKPTTLAGYGITDAVLKTGDTMTGTLTIHPATGIAIELIQSTNSNALLQLDKGTSGFYSYFVGSTNAKARWLMALGDTTAEAGSNAGSDFLLQAYDDTGANPQVVMRGLRSTGLLTVKADPTAALGIATKQYVDAKPAGAVISDTPPASPSQGQTWWESDTGAFYISFNDGNSTQWVQINGPMQPGLDAPNDGGEYVRVNGVWRLSKQSFYPTGSGGQVFTVPPTAKTARIYGQIWLGTQPSAAILRVSADGSTFLNGASDYSYGHNQLVTGSATTPVKQAPIAASALQMHPTSDNTTIPQQFDCDLMVSKPASPAVFGARWRGSSYHSNAATLYSEFLGNGYVAAAAATALTQLPAFIIVPSGGSWAAGTVLRVEWVY